ncbi:COP9 signalosome complex subunit 3-like isoform X2 [Quercus lobata]|nr:COP9 signalosome complex subunit 3-like isoform X2 [Quercus lobata]
MRFKELVIILGTPMHVHVDLFLAAVWKLQNSSEHLTTLHPHFLHISLLVNCSKTGQSNLEEDISEVDHLDDLFLYCYYGLPKYTSSAAWRNLKSFCQPYIELANSYSTGEIAELEANIQTNKENFKRDQNLGPVELAVPSKGT